MNRPKIFLYVIYLLFISLSFVFILFTDRMFDELGIQRTLTFLKYWAISGLFLFLIEILTESFTLRNRRKEIKRLNSEKDALKARIYDLEEKDRAMDKSIKAFEGSLKSKPQNKPDQENL